MDSLGFYKTGCDATSIWLYLLFTSIVSYLGYGTIYRLVLSPLAKFPGPKFAALTFGYEAYYQCVKGGGGQYYVEINKMHDKYGPIVRINPVELHIRDPDWSEVYRITRRTNKPTWYYCFLDSSGNTFGAEPWQLHRHRRWAIRSFFTARAVVRYYETIDSLVAKLLRRLKDASGQVVRLDLAFHCLATDAATGFALATPLNHLDSPDFEFEANSAIVGIGKLGMINRYLGGLVLPMLGAISRVIRVRNPEANATGLRGYFKQLYTTIHTEFEREKSSVVAEETLSIMQQILRSDLPPEEKTRWRVTRESSSVALAGTETTGSLMYVTAFLVLTHPDKRAVLTHELGEAEEKAGGKPSYSELKDLPYLTGVINEGFRLHSLSGRVVRYDPAQDMTYKEWTIPKGTCVSTTQNDTHFSPDIFPEPHSFVPERWLKPAERKSLSRYLHPWGRGTRMCLGKNLAICEIYTAMGRFFSPRIGFDLEVVDTDYSTDVDMYHDYFSPFPRTVKGIRVSILKH